jgi:hypothetical protein
MSLQNAAILTQAEIQNLLLNRGGNKMNNGSKDFWEGFTDKKQNVSSSFNDNLTNLPHKNSQPEVTNFLKDRGGNKGPTRQQNNEHPNVPVVEGFSNQIDQEEVFYPGDKILSGNYFDGWNDTYFFNKSIFRDNLEFWVNPFKEAQNKKA